MYKDDEAISAIKAHAEGVIKKHVFNVKVLMNKGVGVAEHPDICLLYTSPSPRD